MNVYVDCHELDGVFYVEDRKSGRIIGRVERHLKDEWHGIVGSMVLAAGSPEEAVDKIVKKVFPSMRGAEMLHAHLGHTEFKPIAFEPDGEEYVRIIYGSESIGFMSVEKKVWTLTILSTAPAWMQHLHDVTAQDCDALMRKFYEGINDPRYAQR